jgi:hypothetical protein
MSAKLTVAALSEQLSAMQAAQIELALRLEQAETRALNNHALLLEMRAKLDARDAKPQAKLDPKRIQSAVYFWLRRYDAGLKCFWDAEKAVLDIKSEDPNLHGEWTLEKMERYSHHQGMVDCPERNKVRALFSIGKGAPAPEAKPAAPAKPSARAEAAVKSQPVCEEDLAGVNF